MLRAKHFTKCFASIPSFTPPPQFPPLPSPQESDKVGTMKPYITDEGSWSSEEWSKAS